MYPSGGLGGSGRDSAGHPAGSIDDSLFNGLDARGRSTSRYPYSNIVPARPAPPPPTSGMSGLHRRGTSGGARGDAFSRMTSRRGSLGIPPSSVSGLSASRPMGFSGDLELPHLEPLVPSTRRSGGGHRSREVTTPGLGSGRLGGGLGMPGGLLDAGPSLLSQSQPIDIAPLSPLGGINDWRNRISPGSPLENPTLRETRREARHRARDDWERDAELRESCSWLYWLDWMSCMRLADDLHHVHCDMIHFTSLL